MLAALASAAVAGPWVHAPGTWYAKVGVGVFRADQYVAPGAATSDSGPRYVGRTASAYTEVGLLDPIELVAELPWVWSSNRFEGSELRYRETGPGSLRVGLGATVPRSDLPIALHVIGRVPLFDHEELLPLDPAIGEEQVDVDVVASGGASIGLGTWRAWGLLEAGWRDRTRLVPVRDRSVVDFDDAATYRAQIGLLPRWRGRELGWAYGDTTGVVGLADARRTHSVGAGVAVALAAGLHAELGASTVLAARRDGRGSGFTVGLSHVGKGAEPPATPADTLLEEDT